MSSCMEVAFGGWKSGGSWVADGYQCAVGWVEQYRGLGGRELACDLMLYLFPLFFLWIFTQQIQILL